MAHINFVIPQSKNELLSDNDEQYYVRNVVSIKEIEPSLEVAKQCLKDEGPQFILDNFDTYFSVIYHSDNLQMNTLMIAYKHLHKAAETLNNATGFLLDDKDSLGEEDKLKWLNVLKMLLYVYTSTATTIEQKLENKRAQTLPVKGRARKKNPGDDSGDGLDKKDVLLVLNNLIHREISIFWEPPVVEETFVNMVAEVCYRFLEIPTIKSQKEIRVELFNMLGTLVKGYNHGMTFVVRIVQLIKMHDHLVQCVPEGIEILVESYNCKSLVRDFTREITEWQTDEKFQDAQGSRNCSNVLFEMANLMPNLMVEEVMYLTRYLAHDSYTLRNSILYVISEVVLTVLTKVDLSEEQRECRDDFLAILEEHMCDTSAMVRSKVFQQWARLQQENAVPVKIQLQILEKAVMFLRDRAANVRKSAANLVTTFLSHNIYGAKLQLDTMQAELELKQEVLVRLQTRMEGSLLSMRKKVQEQWALKEKDMREVIKEKLKDGSECGGPPESQISKKDLPELMRLYVLEDKFVEAFLMCRSAATYYPEWLEVRADLTEDEQTEIFLILIKNIFTDIGESSEGGQFGAPTESDIQQLETLQNTVDYLTGAVGFLTQIGNAVKPMTDLLESVSIGDMQEAIEFFIAAYQFNINNAVDGVLEMLKIMQRNEKERKDQIINAFKTIYLTTESNNMRDHTTIIVNRLINLLQTVPFENASDFHLILAEWVGQGILDNSIIDMFWQYFTKKVDVSEDESCAAVLLLALASKGRRTIVTKNIKLIATVAFGDRGKNNEVLVTAACQFLQIVGTEKQNITDANPPLRIKNHEPMWKDLMEILVSNFQAGSSRYNELMSEAIECVYRLCSKPDMFCEELIDRILKWMREELRNSNGDLQGCLIAQLVHLLGEVALKELNFLDETVYKELKRRNYVREERKNVKKKGKASNLARLQNASAVTRASNSSTASNAVDESSVAAADESTLEGAQAEDGDAEYILQVLEKETVCGKSRLGQLVYLIVAVCGRPDLYDNVYVQGTAVIALLRHMIVSSKFCEEHMKLIFTILEKTKFPEIKCNTLIHCSDLLERFPNVIEPWTPRLYDRLRDDCVEVRKNAFFILSNLILRDMIRVQGHISEMAYCIVDEDVLLRDISKNFFTQLSHKANNLYNVLPDIFSHLSEQATLEENQLRLIMKFLFGLIDKNKLMENLVDRFCSKFRLTEDAYRCRNIAFCLSLIHYNEKGLRRLQDSFAYYKNSLLNDDVYAFFKTILNTYSKSAKNEIKEIVVELEEKINGVFETDENGPQTPGGRVVTRPNQEKSSFKKPRGRAPKKKAKKKSRASDSDESDDESAKENGKSPAPRIANRTRRNTQRSLIIDSDSD